MKIEDINNIEDFIEDNIETTEIDLSIRHVDLSIEHISET